MSFLCVIAVHLLLDVQTFDGSGALRIAIRLTQELTGAAEVRSAQPSASLRNVPFSAGVEARGSARETRGAGITRSRTGRNMAPVRSCPLSADCEPTWLPWPPLLKSGRHPGEAQWDFGPISRQGRQSRGLSPFLDQDDQR